MSQLTEALTQAVSQAEQVFDDDAPTGDGDDLTADLTEGVEAAKTADTDSVWESVGVLVGLVAASALRRRMREGDGLGSAGDGGGGAEVVRDLMNEGGSGGLVEMGDRGGRGEKIAATVDSVTDANTDSGSDSSLRSALKRVAVLAVVGAVAYVALRRGGSGDGAPSRAGEGGLGDLGLGSSDDADLSEERETPETAENTAGNPGRGDFDDEERATTSGDAETELGSDEDVDQHVHRGSSTDEEAGESERDDENESAS